MNIFLDTRTIIILLSVGYLLTLLLMYSYGRNHTKALPFKLFVFSKFLQFISSYCFIYRGEIPDFLSISVANSVFFIGSSLEVFAVLSLLYTFRLKDKIAYFLLTIFFIIGFQLIDLLFNKEYLRIAYSSFTVSILLIPSYKLFNKKHSTALRRIVGFLYLLVIIISIGRGITALISSTISASIYTPGVFQLIFLLSVYLFMILGNIGFTLLTKEKTDQELYQLASYDDLTGALNRRTFTTMATHYLHDYAKKGQPISYLLLDIDHFKTINDTYGHHLGDQILQSLSSIIKQFIDSNDLFVRYGGDEFGILMPKKDEVASSHIANLIIQTLNDEVYQNFNIPYTISMGILTVVPKQFTNLETLYITCDKALYQAKLNGRNGVFRCYIEETISAS